LDSRLLKMSIFKRTSGSCGYSSFANAKAVRILSCSSCFASVQILLRQNESIIINYQIMERGEFIRGQSKIYDLVFNLGSEVDF